MLAHVATHIYTTSGRKLLILSCNGYNNGTGMVLAEGTKMHSSQYDVSDYHHFMSLSIY